MFGHLAFRRFRYAGPVIAGALLSASIEMIQLYTPSRQCSTVDLATNIAGSALGVLAGIVFEKLAGPLKIQLPFRSDRSALALVFCQAASLSFPLFPDTSLPDWERKIALFVHGPWLNPVALISAAASWFAIALMVRRPLWAWSLALLLPAQIFIATRQPAPVALLGAIVGLAACAAARRISFAAVGCGFLAVLLFRGLSPFHLISRAQEFGWIPFIGLLHTEWQYGIQVLLEKIFYYGTAVWLLRRAGLKWSRSIGYVCLVLAAVEVAQIHLPGRTPEITDPILALITGLGLLALEIPLHSPLDTALERPRPIGYHANS
jgi:VanZ family protein